MENKKIELENYIRKFFDDFSQIDSKVFSDLKKSIHENEASMIYHMELIKNNVSNYFNEAPPEKDKFIIKKAYEERNAILEKSRPRPIKITKEQFEEMDKSSNGFFSLQMDRVKTLKKFYSEIEKIK